MNRFKVIHSAGSWRLIDRQTGERVPYPPFGLSTEDAKFPTRQAARNYVWDYEYYVRTGDHPRDIENALAAHAE